MRVFRTSDGYVLNPLHIIAFRVSEQPNATGKSVQTEVWTSNAAHTFVFDGDASQPLIAAMETVR